MQKFNHSYSNGEISVTFKPRLCIHSTICLNLNKVFNLSKTPWINMHGASTQEIIDTVEQCPSGALSFVWDKKHEPQLTHGSKTSEVEVNLLKNGPLIIKSDVKVTDENGHIEHRKGVSSFCRCGKTKKPPYCDGSHK